MKAEEYLPLRTVKNYPQPKKDERVSLIKIVEAAIVNTGTTDSTLKTAVGSYSFSHTTTSGDTILMFGGGTKDGVVSTHDSVTFNSDTLTEAREATFNSSFSGQDVAAAIWYLASPDIGSGLTLFVDVSAASTDAARGLAANYSGTETTLPIRDNQGGTDSDDTQTVTLTTVSGDMTFGVFGVSACGGDAYTTETLLLDVSTTLVMKVTELLATGSSTETGINNTGCSSSTRVKVGVSIKPATAAARRVIIVE